ncbi:MAG TPA: deaminase, partial [Bacteroidetes bacterium]|nr:deaminase [Bacteroidota bacterium]
IDTARYYVNPVLLGGGIRVFPELTDRLVMRRKEVQTFGNGVVALEFDLQS